MKEERISQRVQIELPAQFCFEKQPNSWFEATVINISTHGFCFRTAAKHNEALNGKPLVRLSIGLSKDEMISNLMWLIPLVISGSWGVFGKSEINEKIPETEGAEIK